MPKIVSPLSLADKNAALEGSIAIKEFGRLSELLFDQNGQAAVSLVFSRRDGLPRVKGRVAVVLELKCQRCLEAIRWPIDLEINLGVVSSVEQANRLPDGVEPFLIIEEKTSLAEIIEDELLLSIPAIPRHDNDCSIPVSGYEQARPENNLRPASENPFSKLAVLKKTEN